MKLEQLVHVVEIAKAQSISRAAEKLLLSQPGLSASIKQLENELGADLFIRNSKGVELTAVGSSFVAHAKKVLDQVDALEKQCKGNTAQLSRTLSIASGPYRFIGLLTAMLLNKHKEDDTRYVLRTGVDADCIDWVADGICDVGVVSYNACEEKAFRKLMQQKQLQYHNIYQVEAKVIIGAGHPLFNTDATEVAAEELLRYPMIAQDQTTAKDYFRSVFLQTKDNNLRVIATDQAAVYEMLEVTDGYCIGHASEYMYRNLPRQHRTRELKVVSAQPDRTIVMAWIAPVNMEFMPLAGEFLQAVSDVCTRPDFWQLHPELKKPL